MSYFNKIKINTDDATGDAFSRLRVSQPENLFNVQCQYTRAAIQMESGNTGSGTLPAHDANTRMVALVSTGTGTSFMQSYSYIPYQPGKSQFIALTGVIGAAVAGATVDLGYFDPLNGIFLRQNGTTNLQIVRRTSTSGSVVETAVASTSWNIDKLDGTGVSGKTLDITKAQILVIDLQFLGMGRVRIGFDLDGVICFAHQFLNANSLAVPYMQSASLPIGMLVTTTSGAKTSYFKCAAVHSEGGNLDLFGYMLATPDMTVTAGSGTRTPIVAIRPKTTYNSIPNRQYNEVIDLQMIVTGAKPVFWELVVGGTYSGQAWGDVNTSYSGLEYSSTQGTYTNLTGGAVIANGYLASGGAGGTQPAVTPIPLPPNLSKKWPISLDRAGAVRAMGTYTLLVTGIGGTSDVRASINYKEIR